MDSVWLTTNLRAQGTPRPVYIIDPLSKLIMVHTAVRQKPNDPANAEARTLWDAVVQELGKK